MMHRRRFLQFAGGAMTLPLLQIPRVARAQSGPEFPTRLIIFYQPNGTKKELWSPSMGSSENDFDLGRLLAPLEDTQ